MEEVIISVYYMLEGFEIYRMYFFNKAWGLSFHLFRERSASRYVAVSSSERFVLKHLTIRDGRCCKKYNSGTFLALI